MVGDGGVVVLVIEIERVVAECEEEEVCRVVTERKAQDLSKFTNSQTNDIIIIRVLDG